MSKHMLEESILTSFHRDKCPYRQLILKKQKQKQKTEVHIYINLSHLEK